MYGEINGTQPLFDRVYLLVHVGLLRTRAGYGYGYGSQSTQKIVDGRIAIGADFDWVRIEFGWVGISNSNVGYRITESTSPNRLVLTLSHSF